MNDTYHVVPTSDVIGHDTDGSDCVCGPRSEAVFREDGSNGWIVIHHCVSSKPPHTLTFTAVDKAGDPA